MNNVISPEQLRKLVGNYGPLDDSNIPILSPPPTNVTSFEIAEAALAFVCCKSTNGEAQAASCVPADLRTPTGVGKPAQGAGRREGAEGVVSG